MKTIQKCPKLTTKETLQKKAKLLQANGCSTYREHKLFCVILFCKLAFTFIFEQSLSPCSKNWSKRLLGISFSFQPLQCYILFLGNLHWEMEWIDYLYQRQTLFGLCFFKTPASSYQTNKTLTWKCCRGIKNIFSQSQICKRSIHSTNININNNNNNNNTQEEKQNKKQSLWLFYIALPFLPNFNTSQSLYLNNTTKRVCCCIIIKTRLSFWMCWGQQGENILLVICKKVMDQEQELVNTPDADPSIDKQKSNTSVLAPISIHWI